MSEDKENKNPDNPNKILEDKKQTKIRFPLLEPILKKSLSTPEKKIAHPSICRLNPRNADLLLDKDENYADPIQPQKVQKAQLNKQESNEIGRADNNNQQSISDISVHENYSQMNDESIYHKKQIIKSQISGLTKETREENAQRINESKNIQDLYTNNNQNQVFETEIKQKFDTFMSDKYLYFVLTNVLEQEDQEEHQVDLLDLIVENLEKYAIDPFGYRVVTSAMDTLYKLYYYKITSQNQYEHLKPRIENIYLKFTEYVLSHSNMDQLPTNQFGNYVVSKAILIFKESDAKILFQKFVKNIVINGNNVQTKQEQEQGGYNDNILQQQQKFENFDLCGNQYGCLMIQTLIKAYTIYKDKNSECHIILKKMMDRIRDKAVSLSKQQFSNYVVQQMILYGDEEYRQKINTEIIDLHFLDMSKDKFGSNVVEKVVETLSEVEIRQIYEVLCQNNSQMLLEMINHKYANFVLKKLYEIGSKDVSHGLYNCVSQLRQNGGLQQYGGKLLQGMHEIYQRNQYNQRQQQQVYMTQQQQQQQINDSNNILILDRPFQEQNLLTNDINSLNEENNGIQQQYINNNSYQNNKNQYQLQNQQFQQQKYHQNQQNFNKNNNNNYYFYTNKRKGSHQTYSQQSQNQNLQPQKFNNNNQQQQNNNNNNNRKGSYNNNFEKTPYQQQYKQQQYSENNPKQQQQYRPQQQQQYQQKLNYNNNRQQQQNLSQKQLQQQQQYQSKYQLQKNIEQLRQINLQQQYYIQEQQQQMYVQQQQQQQQYGGINTNPNPYPPTCSNNNINQQYQQQYDYNFITTPQIFDELQISKQQQQPQNLNKNNNKDDDDDDVKNQNYENTTTNPVLTLKQLNLFSSKDNSNQEDSKTQQYQQQKNDENSDQNQSKQEKSEQEGEQEQDQDQVKSEEKQQEKQEIINVSSSFSQLSQQSQ